MAAIIAEPCDQTDRLIRTGHPPRNFGVNRAVLAALGVCFGAAAFVGLALAEALTPFGLVPPPSAPPLSGVFAGLFAFYAFSALCPALLYMAWSGFRRDRPLYSAVDDQKLPRISLIIPAYNEEACIAETLEAAKSQDYPDYEILVVDDGSQDRTRDRAEAAGVRVLSLSRNRGKAEALNAGVAEAQGELIVTTDADTALASDALSQIVKPLADPKTGAVAGRVGLLSPKGFLHSLQDLEYAYGQQVIKTAQAGSDCPIAILPGPLLAVRRAVLEQIGGFRARTLTEDFDATLEIIQAGHHVAYAPEALALTDAPGTWVDLHRQRLRWARGMLQTLMIHRGMWSSARYGLFSLFWLPTYLIGGFFMLALDLVLLAVIAALGLAAGLGAVGFAQILISILLIELLASGLMALALALAGQRSPRFLVWCGLLKPMKLFLAFVRLQALYSELRGGRRAW
ncbi:MAG: glycosyltransferase family 2 protein [Alphaproteobacteria bacterium]|nr:glycosyltransferase family 2 protein [Alphaproteobacteria bacterium]